MRRRAEIYRPHVAAVSPGRKTIGLSRLKRRQMGCAASTGPLYRDEHDFATTAAYYDKDDDVKKDWVENEQLGEGMFAMLHVRRIQTGNVAGLGEGKRVSCEE